MLLTNNFYGKLSAFASIYLLASIMYCNLWGIATFFAKITRVVFSGLQSTIRLSLQKAYQPDTIDVLRFH